MFITLSTPILHDLWNDVTSALAHGAEAKEEILVGSIPLKEARQMADEAFANIQQGTERIKNIVVELKNYSRETVGDPPERMDVNRIVQSAITLTRNKIKNATDHLQVELAPALPVVYGHPQRLEQVVINLIINACEAMTDKTKSIWIRTLADATHRQVLIRIEDEGCGMPPEVLARLKDPFFTTKRDSGGTGLGVAISAKIVDEHGGDLLFDSKSGQGTLATVVLPVEQRKTEEKALDA